MTDIAIRVENCILSTSTTLSVDSVEGLSKLYHIGRAQGSHDTTSTRLSAGLRDALVSTFKRSNVLTMTDLAIRVENCILSRAEGLSKFYHIGRAKASAGELRAQLYVALDAGYLNQPQFAALFDLAEKCSRQLSRFITYLESQPNTRRVREDTVEYHVETPEHSNVSTF